MCIGCATSVRPSVVRSLRCLFSKGQHGCGSAFYRSGDILVKPNLSLNTISHLFTSPGEVFVFGRMCLLRCLQYLLLLQQLQPSWLNVHNTSATLLESCYQKSPGSSACYAAFTLRCIASCMQDAWRKYAVCILQCTRPTHRATQESTKFAVSTQ